MFASLTACSRARALSFLVVQVPNGLITLLIQLPGCTTLEVLDTAGLYVGHIKNAVITEFKQLEGLKADQLQLFKLGGDGSRTPLDPANTLSEAGIVVGTKLVVELTAATQAPLAGT
jgi:hypothetical protein